MNDHALLVPAIAMPEWLQKIEREHIGGLFTGNEAKLEFSILLANENVRHGTGGPFGAAVFHRETERLLATGVNVVVPSKQFWTHAEITALGHAQHLLDTCNLKECILASSCEPCVMCCGATLWSGVKTLLYAAPGSNAEEIGFDEGEKLPEWKSALEKRHIRVIGPLLPEKAWEPFGLYQQNAGKIY